MLYKQFFITFLMACFREILFSSLKPGQCMKVLNQILKNCGQKSVQKMLYKEHVSLQHI